MSCKIVRGFAAVSVFCCQAISQPLWEDLDFSVGILTPASLYTGIAIEEDRVVDSQTAISLGDMVSLRLSYTWHGDENSPDIMPLTSRSAILKVFVRENIEGAEPVEIPWRWNVGDGPGGNEIQLRPNESQVYDTYIYSKWSEPVWLDEGGSEIITKYLFNEPGVYEIYAETYTGSMVNYLHWKMNVAGASEPLLIKSNIAIIDVGLPVQGWEDLVELGIVAATREGHIWDKFDDASVEQKTMLNQIIDQLNLPWLTSLREKAVNQIGDPIFIESP